MKAARQNLELPENPLCNAVALYRERGNYLLRLEQFENAIKAYNEALRWNADDVKTLIGRSKARVKATHYNGAMVDVSRAIELQPGNMTAKEIRANTEYGRGNFEQAWILALRGEFVRTFPRNFRECSRTAEETVRECTGKSASKMLSGAMNIIKQKDVAASNAQTESARRLPRFLQEKVPQNIRTADTQRTNRISRLMANLYFGRMAHDKYFLEVLHKDERLKSANQKGTQELREISLKALTDIETRQGILRERLPLYAALASGEAARERLSGARKEGLFRAQQQHAADAKRLVKSVREIYEKQNTQKCLENAQFAMEQISRKPLRFLPRKDKYLQELYDIVAMAFLDQKRMCESISESVREKRALVLLGLTVSREPSKDNILRVRPVATRDPKSRERVLLRLLELSARPSEKCYLLHELSRLLLEMKQGLRARYFAVKCQNESRKASLRYWYLNGTFLLARCHVLQNNRPDARATLLEGATIAKTYGQHDVSSFFETCAHVVVEGDTEYEEAAIEKREKALVGLMADDELKSQAKHLFRRMSVVPVARRFSIMPGTRADDMSPASGAGRRASIMPRTEEPPKIQKSKLKLPLGFQDFDI